MEQEPLFVEDENEAIRHAIAALGGSKIVGHLIWPNLSPPNSGEKLANCLNPLRQEKLSVSEFLYIRREARKIGCHVIAAYENQDAGYAPPQPIEPADEAAELQRKFIEAVHASEKIAQRLKQLSEPAVRAVR